MSSKVNVAEIRVQLRLALSLSDRTLLPYTYVEYLSVYVGMYVCVWVHVCVCMYVCMCMCMYMCIYVRMYVCMHMKLYIYTWITVNIM